ncbi:MAG: glycogen debranching protein [Allomuricauda sp.]
MKNIYPLLISALLAGCSTNTPKIVSEVLTDTPSIKGKDSYLNSPYVAAGDRVYMVGHQNGTFPPLGWHIKGEMGGIWNHPIKLMDGFDAAIIVDNDTLRLDEATTFINYPFANKHVFEFPSKRLVVERLQFVPDGMQGVFIQFVINNTSSQKKSLNFMFTGHADLRPTWLGERTQMKDGADHATLEHGLWVVKDSLNPWFTIFGSDQSPVSSMSFEKKQGENGQSNTLVYPISVSGGSQYPLNFVISGSYKSREEAQDNFKAIQQGYFEMAEQKKARYGQLAHQTKLTIPDKDLQQAFEWLKYNCDWLVRTVPEIGTGIGAGIPDYPWWFGVDSEYALKGYMAIGQEEIVEKTIKLLDSVSMALNGNGRILHEMSTNGAVFNEGNINETPQFASLVWEIYNWNGDREFLKKYFPTVQKGLKWLLEENDSNKNLFPDGFGMMEIHGLDSEMIDVAAYTQRAFEDASKMAHELGEIELSNQYKTLADHLKQKINGKFWSGEFGSFADFLGTDEQAIHLIEDAIVRADTLNKPWAAKELEETKQRILDHSSKELKPFVLHHNWVVNTPMEMGIADSAKALTALDTAKKFTNPFGMFVTGIDRDDSAGKDFGSFKGSKVFSYTGAVMTLPTGVQVIAENNYGRPDDALGYLQRMTRTFSYALPGSIYEVSPDYGMMAQAWNIYAFAIPIVQQFFGIRPMAQQQTVSISPQMPSSWNDASLEHVKVGDNEISVFYKNKGEITVHQTNPSWKIRLILPKDEYTVVQGEAEIIDEADRLVFLATNKELTVAKK